MVAMYLNKRVRGFHVMSGEAFATQKTAESMGSDFLPFTVPEGYIGRVCEWFDGVQGGGAA